MSQNLSKLKLLILVLLGSWTFAQDDCLQGDDTDGMGPARNVTKGSNYRAADDFLVSSGNSIGVNAIEFYISSDTPVTDANLIFYEDNDGLPDTGSIKYELNDIVPTYQVSIGSNGSSSYIYRVIFNLEEELVFDGGAEGARYWVEPQVSKEPGGYEYTFWHISRSGTLGNTLFYSSDGGTNWTTYTGDLQFHGVFKISCDHIEEPIQDPYCVSFIGTVEPISLVKFGEINNPTSPVMGGSARNEYFLDQVANVNRSQTYELAVEGNTGEELTNYITAFIDWNQNGVLNDEGEVYDVGTLYSTDGMDGQQAKLEITIPESALLGNTRMRILKRWGESPTTNPCGVLSWGQTEDYTVNIGENVLPECTIECPEDIIVQAEEGETTAIVTYEINFECDNSEGVELVLTEGLASGSEFPVGTTTVSYNLVYNDTVLNTCSFEVEVEEHLGVSDLTNESLAFYPNPVQDVLNISYNQRITKVSVYDLSGRKVFITSENNKQIQIDLSRIPSGVYIVKVDVGGEARSFKIVKK
mgnify:CR=1 FL=1